MFYKDKIFEVVLKEKPHERISAEAEGNNEFNVN